MKLKTTKSYHSSALPMTAATIARVFGVLLKAREPRELPDLSIAMSPSPMGRFGCAGLCRVRQSCGVLTRRVGCLGECKERRDRFQAATKNAPSLCGGARFDDDRLCCRAAQVFMSGFLVIGVAPAFRCDLLACEHWASCERVGGFALIERAVAAILAGGVAREFGFIDGRRVEFVAEALRHRIRFSQ